ncbi:hypothetical protein U8V72_27440 [Priestia filamentosa]|uniref:hypothetical protein n=1 Tax=Priestia filamentosa TaxID=1402861 RepID=UPI00397BEF35
MNNLELQEFKNYLKSLNNDDFNEKLNDLHDLLEHERENFTLKEKIQSISLVEIFYKESKRRYKEDKKRMVKLKLGVYE